MKGYIAWLNGQSAAVGTLAYCRERAMEIMQTPAFQEWGGWPCTLKITRGSRQSFVESKIYHKDEVQS